MFDYTIDVTFQNGILTFSGSSDSAGDLDVDWGGQDSRTIAFRLYGGTGDEWAGIRISKEQGTVLQAPTALDTQGQFYGGTCFKVGPTTQAPAPPVLVLTDFDLTHAGGAWFYCVGIRHSDNSQSWPDPKIENPGGDSRGAQPGFYFGGQEKTKRTLF